MPFVTIAYADKPVSAERKAKLIRDITDIVVKDLEVPAAAVNVILQPVDPSRWGVAGEGLDVTFARHAPKP